MRILLKRLNVWKGTRWITQEMWTARPTRTSGTLGTRWGAITRLSTTGRTSGPTTRTLCALASAPGASTKKVASGSGKSGPRGDSGLAASLTTGKVLFPSQVPGFLPPRRPLSVSPRRPRGRWDANEVNEPVPRHLELIYRATLHFRHTYPKNYRPSVCISSIARRRVRDGRPGHATHRHWSVLVFYGTH